jgi:hypothetical protein
MGPKIRQLRRRIAKLKDEVHSATIRAMEKFEKNLHNGTKAIDDRRLRLMLHAPSRKTAIPCGIVLRPQDQLEYLKNALAPTGIDHLRDAERLNAINRILAGPEAAEKLQLFGCDRPYTAEDFRAAVKVLNPNSASGTEGLNREILLLAPNRAINMLVELLNDCLEKGVWPDAFKKSRLALVPKTNPGEYRIVCIGPYVAKVFERMILARLFARENLDLDRLVGRYQVGFLPRVGACEPEFAWEIMAEWFKSQQKPLVTMMIDIRKAFEHASQLEMVLGAAHYPVTHKDINLLMSYLGRTGGPRKIYVPDLPDECVASSMGCPTGSVLGPLCFMMCVNRLDRQQQSGGILVPSIRLGAPPIEFGLQMYADDTKVVGSSWDGPEGISQVMFGEGGLAQRLELLNCVENHDKREAFALNASTHVPLPGTHLQTATYFKSLGMFHGEVDNTELNETRKKLYAFQDFLECHNIPIAKRNLLLRTVVEMSIMYPFLAHPTGKVLATLSSTQCAAARMILGLSERGGEYSAGFDAEREERIDKMALLLVGVRPIETTFKYLVGLQAGYATRSYRARHGELSLTILNEVWRKQRAFSGPLINYVLHIFRGLCDPPLPTADERLRGADIPGPMTLLLGDGKGDFPDAIRSKKAMKAAYRLLFFKHNPDCKLRQPVKELGVNLQYFAQFFVNRYSSLPARDLRGLCLFCAFGTDAPSHIAACVDAAKTIINLTKDDEALLAYLSAPVLDDRKRDMRRVGQLARELVHARRSRLGVTRTPIGVRQTATDLRSCKWPIWPGDDLEEQVRLFVSAAGGHMHEWSTVDGCNGHEPGDCLYAATAYLMGYPTNDARHPMRAIARQIRYTAAEFLASNTSAVGDNRALFASTDDGHLNVASCARELARTISRLESATLREVRVLETLFGHSFDVIEIQRGREANVIRASDAKPLGGLLLLLDGHWWAVERKPAVTPSRPVRV